MSETVKQEGDFKIKKKRGRPKKLTQNQKETIKVDLSNKDKEEEKKEVENAVQEQTAEEVMLQSDEQSEETGEETKVGLREVGETHEEKQITSNEGEKQEEVVNSPISEITEEEKEEVGETKVEDVKTEVEQPKVDLPENIEKLVNFMKETGGTIDDYVRLNADYSNVDNDVLLREYYRKSKPHLDDEEINFILEDDFSYDEELDEERDVRKKKLAYKEEIAKAKTFLEETKKKYYDEIKLRPGVTQDQQKATDFFNRYNKEQGEIQKRYDKFKKDTQSYFTDFKGFDFNVGEKQFKYNVNNVDSVVENQSALANFVKKFLNKDGTVRDLQGYHKALYAGANADNIAMHFYEQGKADAIKDVTAKSKNISNEARKAPGDIFINGLKVKAVNGVDSSKLKIKKRKTT